MLRRLCNQSCSDTGAFFLPETQHHLKFLGHAESSNYVQGLLLHIGRSVYSGDIGCNENMCLKRGFHKL